MLIGIMGKMGSGKTLTQSALAYMMAQMSGVPLFANYDLRGAERIESLSQLWKIDSGIFCFDEIWLSLDSRLWTNNVQLTRWVNQTRKKKLIVFYTTQHINQVEMRVRKGTDVLIYTQKAADGGIYLNFIDYQYQKLGRRTKMSSPGMFYDLYNTYEVVSPIAMR